MPLMLSDDTPRDGPEIIDRTLTRLGSHPLRRARPGATLGVLPPIRSYGLRADDLFAVGADDTLRAAQPDGWVYMLAADPGRPADPLDDVAGVVELVPPGMRLDAVRTADGWSVGAIDAGPVYRQLGQVIRTAVGSPLYAAADYEPRLLSAPVAGVRAVWLHESDELNDRFYRLTGRADELPQPVTRSEFLHDLTDRLSARREAATPRPSVADRPPVRFPARYFNPEAVMLPMAAQAENIVSALSTRSDDELFTDLGIQLDKYASELVLAGYPDAPALLYGGASPGDDKPGFLRRLGLNFMRKMSSQFYQLLCDPKHDEHKYVSELIQLGKAGAALKLAGLLTASLSLTGPVALIVGTILAGWLIASAHQGMCQTLADMRTDRPAG